MEQNEEIDFEKIGITVLVALALGVAVQWLFAKCLKCTNRNNQPKEDPKVKMLKVAEEESSDEFELVNHEEAV